MFLFVPLLALGAAAPSDDYGAVGDFALTERGGRVVRRDDLLGKVWVASFEFTRCTSGCPQISETMERLQGDFARSPDVRLVTFTVDPEHDRPEELREYADRYHADPERWLFLTGDEQTVHELLRKSFRVPVQKNTAGDPGNAVLHSPKLVLVDRRGHVRGYYDGRPDPNLSEADFESNLRKLRDKATTLEHEAWYLPDDFPRFHAALNACTAVLLVLGYAAIRRRLVRPHVTCMATALALSVLFLASYVYHKAVIKHGLTTSFAEQTGHANPPAWVGVVYQVVLWTHTPLATLVVPLALASVALALGRRWRWHVRLARWTLPAWLYSAVTGVVVYWMLYRLYPLP